MLAKIIHKVLPLVFAAASFGAVGLAPSVARADGYFSCTPDHVYELSNRVHVHCTNSWAAGADTVTYIAIDKTDPAKVERFIMFAHAALLGKKAFRVYLLTSSATNVSGCLASDCRTPTLFGVREE